MYSLNLSELRQLLTRAAEALPHDYELAAQLILAVRNELERAEAREEADLEAQYQRYVAECGAA